MIQRLAPVTGRHPRPRLNRRGYLTSPVPVEKPFDSIAATKSLIEAKVCESQVETRIANDLEELLAWINAEGDEPRTIYEAAFQPSRLHTLRTRLSAAYKGLNILMVRDGAKDFFWKATLQELDHEEVALDIHHIFPKAWCEQRGLKPAVFNAIINKTPLSYKANRMIGGKAPSRYLASLQGHPQVGLADSAMDAILASHRIDPDALRADDFERFYARRQASLLALVEQAMGKAVEQEAAEDRRIELEKEESPSAGASA